MIATPISGNGKTGGSVEPRARTGATLIARVPVALWILLAIGILVRASVWATYSPAALNLLDSAAWVGAADGELFGDATRTVGYPIFLRATHLISGQLEWTIFLQHVLGVGTALLLYATVRRIGAPVWAAIVACAAIMLPIDQVFLEHAVMSETLFTAFVVASAYAAIRSLDPPSPAFGRFTSRHGWIALSAASLGLATWVRPVALLLVPLAALWFALAIPASLRSRALHGALAVAVAAAILAGYGALQSEATGRFGLTQAAGWATYSRTAPFADCSQFDPPPGTRPLCETTPFEQRPGPDFYGQQPDSPARKLFGAPPEGNEQLQAFGRRAILAQPLEYLKAVGTDMWRYVDPTFRPRDFSGAAYDVIDIDRGASADESVVDESLNTYYADDEVHIDGLTATLSDVQDTVRVHPKLLFGSFIVALIGLVLARGRVRSGLALLLGVGLTLLAVPPITAIWSSRYAIPAQGFILAAGAIGVWLVLSVRSRTDTRSERSELDRDAHARPAAAG